MSKTGNGGKGMEGKTSSEFSDSSVVVVDKMAQVNCLTWALLNRLQLRRGVYFELTGTKYLLDIVHRPVRRVCVKKGSQVRATTTLFLEAIHQCIYGSYRQNILYMMPTVRQVEALAKISFDPILELNDCIGRYVQTNTAYLKTVNGRSIYFVGSQPMKIGGTKDSVNLRSIPCDVVMRDEIDLMDSGMVELSRQRLRDSLIKKEVDFGSPTFPGYGIDKLYQDSCQYMWEIPCRFCRSYTVLGRDFPKSVKLVDGQWIRCCARCGRPIRVEDGSWQAQYPSRKEQAEGFWIDGLMSPRADISDDMARWEQMDSEYARSEFLRSVLGIASLEANQQLNEGMIARQIVSDSSAGLLGRRLPARLAMGVDVGELLHYAIGFKDAFDRFHIIRSGSVKEFEDLYRLIHAYSVGVLVLDAQPEIHSVRSFVQRCPCRVFRCYYSSRMQSEPIWNGEEKKVQCNRNEWCDKLYEQIVSGQMLFWSDGLEDRQDFIRQLTSTARVLQENPETGFCQNRWVKLGDDHYFHALVYFLLASSIIHFDNNRLERPGCSWKQAKDTFVIRG